MFDLIGFLAMLGWASVCVFLVVMGRLSQRLGQVTKAKPHHIGFYVASGFVAVSILIRAAHLTTTLAEIRDLQDNTLWVLLYNGTPAIGVTIGLLSAWRYWSWLLAERD